MRGEEEVGQRLEAGRSGGGEREGLHLEGFVSVPAGEQAADRLLVPPAPLLPFMVPFHLHLVLKRASVRVRVGGLVLAGRKARSC